MGIWLAKMKEIPGNLLLELINRVFIALYNYFRSENGFRKKSCKSSRSLNVRTKLVLVLSPLSCEHEIPLRSWVLDLAKLLLRSINGLVAGK